MWSWLRLRVLGDPGHPLVLGPAEARSFSNAAEVSRKRTGDDSFRFGILVDARMESAEAARRRSSAAASAACVESAATAAGAFDASGLTVYLKDVVTLCLENRPSDPVAFIAEYLRRVTHRTTPVSRACQYLRLAPHHRRAFMDNAAVAHAGLCAGSNKTQTQTPGVRPEDHLLVLRETCARLPRRVVETAARAALSRPGRTSTCSRVAGSCSNRMETRSCAIDPNPMIPIKGVISTDRLLRQAALQKLLRMVQSRSCQSRPRRAHPVPACSRRFLQRPQCR